MGGTSNLGDQILEAYTRTEFGKVPKSEIDALVFHFFLLKHLDKALVADGTRIRYFHLTKSEIHQLSLRAKISESRIKSLVERDFFLHGSKENLDDFLLNLVNAASVKKSLLKTGKIQFLVTNPIVKKFLEERVAAVGGIPDYSFNHEVLVLEISDFLKILNFTDNRTLEETITHNILKKAQLGAEDPQVTAFFAELNKVPLEERLKRIALGAAEKLIGKAGDEILGAVFDLVRTQRSGVDPQTLPEGEG